MNTPTIEDVLKKHIKVTTIGKESNYEWPNHLTLLDAIKAAMTEYASLNRQGWTEPKFNLIGEIDLGWHEAGRTFEILGNSIEVGGQRWTPIRYMDEDDPDFIKTAAIKINSTTK